MAKKFIDANLAKKRLHELCAKWSIAYNENDKSGESFSGDIANFVDTLPTVDVQEVRHGKWVHCIGNRDPRDDFYECSICGRTIN